MSSTEQKKTAKGMIAETKIAELKLAEKGDMRQKAI